MPASDYFQPDILGYFNLTTREFTLAPDGGEVVWPELIQSDTLNVATRFLRQIDGVNIEVTREVRGLKASIGTIDARPTGGTFALQIGDPEIAAVEGDNLATGLAWNITAASLQTALNALADKPGAVTVSLVEGSYVITFDGVTEAVELTILENALSPIAFGRVRTSQLAGEWIHELRLMRAPLAFTSTSALAVPPPPSVERTIVGATDEIGNTTNTVQILTVPPEFRGTYRIRNGLKRSALLSREDTPETIAAAINPVSSSDLRLGDDTDAEIRCTLARTGAVRIEFLGSMGGAAVDELTVTVEESPPGDLSFSLSLDKAVASEALRTEAEITAPFEIEYEFEDLNIESEHSRLTYRAEVTLKRELIWDALATQNTTDWLRPPSKEGYVPSDFSEIEVGFANFPFTFGAATETTVDHELGSTFTMLIIQTTAGVRLVEGTDYTVDWEGANEDSLDITLINDYDPAPGAAALNGMVIAFQEVSRYSPHDQAIETITGETGDLREILDLLAAELAALKLLAPNGVTLTATLAAERLSYPLVPVFRVLPVPSRLDLEAPASLAEWDPATVQVAPGRALTYGRLLPAVHDATVEALAATLPTPTSALVGRVFQAAADRDDIGEGLKAGDYAACDGEVWYQVGRETTPSAEVVANATANTLTASHRRFQAGDKVRFTTTGTLPGGLSLATDYYLLTAVSGVHTLSASLGGSAIDLTNTGSGTHTMVWQPTSSYYPTAFEVPLFLEAITGDDLTVGDTLSLQFGFEAALLVGPRRRRARAAEATYTFMLDAGGKIGATSPGTPGENWASNDWNVAMIRKAIQLTETPRPFRFGITIARSLVGGLDAYTATKVISRAQTAADAPLALPFLLRGMLGEFDPRDVDQPRGLVAIRGLSVGLDGLDSETLGQLTIG